MSKINIVNTESDILEGYSNLNIDEVKNITNGTCSEIVCTVLDKLDFNSRMEMINILCKKIANLSFITFKFFNATKLCKDLIKGNINSAFLSKIVAENESLFIESDMIEIITQISNIGIHKIYNDNQYTVIVLQKKL